MELGKLITQLKYQNLYNTLHKNKFVLKNIKILQLNFGPQHPAAHGVLGLIIFLDGEYVFLVDPHIGLLHGGTEKLVEYKPYIQNIPYFDGLDYVSMMIQEHVYCLGIELLLKCSIPLGAQYIGVIFSEITRLLNHLLAITTHALDVGAITPFFLGFEEGEKLFEFYEGISGAGMHSNYFGPGGVINDFPIGFTQDLYNFIIQFSDRIDELEELLSSNGIWQQGLNNIGVINSFQSLNYGFSGPMLGGSGINWDLGVSEPYEIYNQIDFEIPYGIFGDCYDGYLIGVEEMGQSLNILYQSLENFPLGDIGSSDNKLITTSGSKIKYDMESLIHHFKLYTEGFVISTDEIYLAIEAPKGEFGILLGANNTSMPYGCHIKSPGFLHLSALNEMVKGHLLADLVTIIGTQDIVFGEIDG